MTELDLIRLTAYGMTVTNDGGRPMLLLRDERGELTLPVPMGPLEGGVAMAQSNRMAPPSSPHRVTELLLKSMDLKITRCVFSEIDGFRQWVELELENHPLGAKTLRVRADECMSLCLHLEVPVYASRALILKARDYVPDPKFPDPSRLVNPRLRQSPHPYVQ
ncbi:MAG: bifunctional nuclease family protein [Bdellovibrionaceae bacterium]|nr:bifunctional nuclease family protein [Pseudobdellovibrionaceae bacterium]